MVRWVNAGAMTFGMPVIAGLFLTWALVSGPLALGKDERDGDDACAEEVSDASLFFDELRRMVRSDRDAWYLAASQNEIKDQLIEGILRTSRSSAGTLELDALSLELVDMLGHSGTYHTRTFLGSLLVAKSKTSPGEDRFGPVTRAHLHDAMVVLEERNQAARAAVAPDPTEYDDDYPWVVGSPDDDSWHAMDLAVESQATPEALFDAVAAIDHYARPDKRFLAKSIWISTRVTPYMLEYVAEEKVAIVQGFLERNDLEMAMYLCWTLECDLDDLPLADANRMLKRARSRWDRIASARDATVLIRQRLDRSEARLMAAEIGLIAGSPQRMARAGLEKGDWTLVEKLMAALDGEDVSPTSPDSYYDIWRALMVAKERLSGP